MCDFCRTFESNVCGFLSLPAVVLASVLSKYATVCNIFADKLGLVSAAIVCTNMLHLIKYSYNIVSKQSLVICVRVCNETLPCAVLKICKLSSVLITRFLHFL